MKFNMDKIIKYKETDFIVEAEVVYSTTGEVDGHHGQDVWTIEDIEIYLGEQEVYDMLGQKVIEYLEQELIELTKLEKV